MIGSLRGRLADKGSLRITVDVAGVGYDVQVPLSTFERLGAVGDEVRLLIHTHVREDTLALFGFETEAERRVFEALIQVSGIGTKIGLAMLSGLGIEEMLRAVRKRDVRTLQRVPGVGRRTAERLAVEPQDRADRLLAVLSPRPTAGTSERREEVVSALVNLGYCRRDAAAAVDRHDGDGAARFELLLKNALRDLSGA